VTEAEAGYGHSPLATAGSLVILDGAFGIVSPIASRLTSFGVRRSMMAGVLVDPVGMLLALVLCWTVEVEPHESDWHLVCPSRTTH
jgi:hypothetical protein